MICQWCKEFGQRMVFYREKYYHRHCFGKLEAMARKLKGAI